jgi:UDP-N-acetylglucosamine 2-epimerase (non-hydrolysing)
MNRKITTPLSDFHFAPTQKAFQELIQEKIDPKKVFLTGNTSIDALLWALEQTAEVAHLKSLYKGRKLILMTAHRRENFGEPLKKIFLAVREFATQKPNFHIIYPVHPNPNVKDLAHDLLYGLDNVSLISPLNYPELIFLMKECEFVLTDSGGLQEESPALGKPVLVLRASTERPEAVDAGCAKLVGHDAAMILEKMAILSDRSSSLYQSMSQAKNPFGNGTASLQIRELLENQL